MRKVTAGEDVGEEDKRSGTELDMGMRCQVSDEINSLLHTHSEKLGQAQQRPHFSPDLSSSRIPRPEFVTGKPCPSDI